MDTLEKGIKYHNSDIANKYMAEQLMGKNLNVYGFDLPAVVRIEPTNLPEIEANELRIDNLFIFEDGSIGIVDYESDYDENDKIKYLSYITRILKRKRLDHKDYPMIRMLVIYSANVLKSRARLSMNLNCLVLNVEAVFLEDVVSEGIIRSIENRLSESTSLSTEELMQLMILPLTYKEKDDRKKAVYTAVELAEKISDTKQVVSALSGILVFTDKIIDKEYSNEIRRWIKMTQVGRLFEEEKQQAIEEAVKKVTDDYSEELQKKDSLIEKLKAEVVKLGGNVAMF